MKGHSIPSFLFYRYKTAMAVPLNTGISTYYLNTGSTYYLNTGISTYYLNTGISTYSMF